jgi:pimeloyl-ACP methyl ester carboxylesterase
MRVRTIVASAFLLGSALAFLPQTTGLADPDLRVAAGAAEVDSIYIHVPPNGQVHYPARVLVALHGMGGNGEEFSRALLPEADANGWIVIAPTIRFGDWTDSAQIAREEPALIAWLSAYLDQLPRTIGLPIAQRVLLLGHSRGAQLALRYTEFHPERVRGVAAIAAGTYTLPFNVDASNQPLTFPFGLGDTLALDVGRFDAVPTWIGVGGEDANPGDLPRAWDRYLGNTRVQRARTYAEALRQVGVTVRLTVFPGEAHVFTPAMRQAACASLQDVDAAGAFPEIS